MELILMAILPEGSMVPIYGTLDDAGRMDCEMNNIFAMYVTTDVNF